MVAFGLGCIVFLIATTLGLLVGAVLLRAAVAVANRFLGPPALPDSFGQWDDWDSDEPARATQKAPDRTVPEPGLATGALITFVLSVAAAVGCVALVFVAESVLRLRGQDENAFIVIAFLLGLPFTGFVLSFLITVLLPTTFARAVLVAFLFHLFGIVGTAAVGAVMIGVVFVLSG